MCGLTGFWDAAERLSDAQLRTIVADMALTLRHRGPDSGGLWIDPEARVALGHRRLAIIDLSPEGHQPMTSASGNLVIILNGEIYNFTTLRAELEAQGATFRGHSDTEVLLAAIERWGLDRALSRAAGMFAFALLDRRARVLHLARDRLGKKPLYFGWLGRTFAFASEL
ncbi:MAG: asparagine synthetase B family protein, partial [Geminicoccaceae bacterium]